MPPVRILLSALLNTVGPDSVFKDYFIYMFFSISFICASPQRNCRRGSGKSARSRGDGGTKEIRSSKCRVTDTHEVTETVTVYTGPAQVCTRWGPSAESGNGYTHPSLTHWLQLISHWQVGT